MNFPFRISVTAVKRDSLSALMSNSLAALFNTTSLMLPLKS